MNDNLKLDPCPDANGHLTLRHDDGTEHGDTTAQPVATIYDTSKANLLAAAPLLLDAALDALHSGQHACNCGGKCEGTCTWSILKNAIKAARG